MKYVVLMMLAFVLSALGFAGWQQPASEELSCEQAGVEATARASLWLPPAFDLGGWKKMEHVPDSDPCEYALSSVLKTQKKLPSSTEPADDRTSGDEEYAYQVLRNNDRLIRSVGISHHVLLQWMSDPDNKMLIIKDAQGSEEFSIKNPMWQRMLSCGRILSIFLFLVSDVALIMILYDRWKADNRIEE